MRPIRPQCFSTLSPARKRLVEILRRLQFGRIEHLTLVAGDPVFNPMPAIIRTIRVSDDTGVAQVPISDFLLKTPLLELFEHFDSWQNVTITRLEFRHGLPILIELTESEAAWSVDSAGRCE